MLKSNKLSTRSVVIGASAGGMAALKQVLGDLPKNFPAPIMIVQHTMADSGDELANLLNELCGINVKEAEEYEFAQPGTAYLAPANYHLMVESDHSLSLSVDPPVSYARPSIDILFESAARAYGSKLIGVILTGANSDGSQGLKKVKEKGGVAIVQDPTDAAVPNMPLAALGIVQADYVVRLKDMGKLLVKLISDPTG